MSALERADGARADGGVDGTVETGRAALRLGVLAGALALGACAPSSPPEAAPTPPPPPPGQAQPPVRPGPTEAVPDTLLRSPSWETLRATLWVQRAAEFRGLSLGTYRAGVRFLDTALSDPTFRAALEQTGDAVEDLPPAVVLDVDETVLDNAPYQARLILTGETFTPAAWDEWVAEAAAEPMSGALEFTREAARRGVAVFYVTNRDEHHEEPTRRNLERLGFPLEGAAPGEDDVVLVRGEREGWGSDKTSRREWVAERYRIVALFGDDLNDFVNVRGMDVAERDEAYEAFEERVGRGWFFLPNPVYGSWESALLTGPRDLGPEERRRLLLERLDVRR